MLPRLERKEFNRVLFRCHCQFEAKLIDATNKYYFQELMTMAQQSISVLLMLVKF